MASHKPFGHLQHKLWLKEGPGIKLAIWLPTTKSQESTRSQCVQVECNTTLESYKFSSDLVLIEGWSEKLWMPKVPRVQTGTVSGFHFWSPRKKCHSDASAVKSHKEYYMGEGGGFPWVRAMVSQVSPELPVVYPSTKGASKYELTYLLVAFGCRTE